MKRLILLFSFLVLSTALPALAGNVPTMSKDELKAQLNAKNLVLLDVRSGRDWSSSEFKISGAIRAPGYDIAKWSKNYTHDQMLVLYCA